MWSRTLALLIRAVRVDARLLRSHLLRLALLVCVVSMLWWGHLTSMVMGAAGYNFFVTIAWLNYLFGTLAGALFFATAITEEKEEQTLGLLRMADVGPLPLLLGKAAPRLLTVLLILSVQFPFTLLAVTLGGVAWNQVVAVYWTLLAHVVLVGHLGLLCSVLCRSSGPACGLTLGGVLAFVFVPRWLLPAFEYPLGTAVSWATKLYDAGTTVCNDLIEASAATRLNQVLFSGFTGGAFEFQVWTNLLGGLVLFGLAWAAFESLHRNVEHAVARRPAVPRVLTQAIRLQPGRSRRAWRWATVWKDFHFISGGPLMWLAKLAIYGAGVLLFAAALEEWRWERLGPETFGKYLLGVMTWIVIPVELTLTGARVFRCELRDRTWAVLLVLPHSLARTAYAKLAGSLLGLLPAVVYLLAGAVLAPKAIIEFVSKMWHDPTAALNMLTLLTAYLLFLHLVVLFSNLTNAWAGILLAVVTSVVGLIVMFMAVMTPMFLLMFRGGAAPAIDPETYLRVASSIVSLFMLTLAAAVHVWIGIRLRAAAAMAA